MVHGIILENSKEKLWEYRCEVKGYVADQAETGIPKAPFGGKEEVDDAITALAEGRSRGLLSGRSPWWGS